MTRARRLLLPLCLTLATAVAGTSAGAMPQAPPPGQGNVLTLPDGAPRPAATIADIAWLAGAWTGEGFGGRIDEVWSAPAGGSMVGHFRLVGKDGKPSLYELMTVLEVEGSLEIRLKHANPDMTGWEEKDKFVTFKLVKLDATGAYFSGMTLKRSGDDTVEVYLAVRRGSAPATEQKLVYRRAK